MKNPDDKSFVEIPLTAEQQAVISPLLKRISEIDGKLIVTPEEAAVDAKIRERIQAAIFDIVSSIKAESPVSHVNLTGQDMADMGMELSLKAFVDNIENLFVDGDKFAAGDLNLFFSKWSSGFVHGSDSMVALTNLVCKILRSDEKLKMIKEVSWRKPIMANITAMVYDEDIDFKSLKDAKKYCVIGKFLTTEGRVLSYMGTENQNRPISPTKFPINPFAVSALRGIRLLPNDNLGYRAKLELNNLDDLYVATLNREAGAKIATLVELITIASGSGLIIPELKDVFGDAMGKALMCSVKNVPLYDDIKKVFPGDIWFGFDMDAIKIGKTGFKIVPFRCSMPNSDLVSEGSVAVAG